MYLTIRKESNEAQGLGQMSMIVTINFEMSGHVLYLGDSPKFQPER